MVDCLGAGGARNADMIEFEPHRGPVLGRRDSFILRGAPATRPGLGKGLAQLVSWAKNVIRGKRSRRSSSAPFHLCLRNKLLPANPEGHITTDWAQGFLPASAK